MYHNNLWFQLRVGLDVLPLTNLLKLFLMHGIYGAQICQQPLDIT